MSTKLIPVQEKNNGKQGIAIVMDDDNIISIVAKKITGHKCDRSHELYEFRELPPFLAEEIRSRERANNEMMSPLLASFVKEIWEDAIDEDSWYEQFFKEEEVEVL